MPTIDHFVIGLIQQMQEHAPLTAEPSREEGKEAMGKLVNGKAPRTDDICGELLKLGRTKNSAIL